MFELSSVPWWVFCSILTVGAAGYGIALRFVDDRIEGSAFGIYFTGVSSLFLGLACIISYLYGGVFSFSTIGIAAAVAAGIGLVGIDLAIISMYRAGAPVSLGMPLVRIGLALLSALIGVIFLAEHLDIIKAAGVAFSCVGIFLLTRKNAKGV